MAAACLRKAALQAGQFGQDPGRRQLIALVVAEGDLAPDEAIDGANGGERDSAFASRGGRQKASLPGWSRSSSRVAVNSVCMAWDMTSFLSNGRRRSVQLDPGLLDYGTSGGQREDSHDRCDGQAGPTAAGAEDAQRGHHHCNVANRVVAAAQSHRAHVGVAPTPRVEHHRHRHVGQQCEGADRAHRHRLGHGALCSRLRGPAEHKQAKRAHGQALEESGPRAPGQCHAKHNQRDAVVRGVAKEVHGIGQQ